MDTQKIEAAGLNPAHVEKLVTRVQREVRRLKGKQAEGQDEVLALLEETS